ncbi:MAG TPA: hypothetical protein VFF12_06765 [Myxococcaceae bacterium]|nr:hypothetical protein [Myxococcaceae bacterium]
MFSEGWPLVRPRMFPLEEVPGNEKEPTPRVISQGPGDAARRRTTGLDPAVALAGFARRRRRR